MTDRELKSALHAVFQKHRDSGVLSQNFKDGLAQYYTSSNPKLYINRMQYFVDLFDQGKGDARYVDFIAEIRAVLDGADSGIVVKEESKTESIVEETESNSESKPKEVGEVEQKVDVKPEKIVKDESAKEVNSVAKVDTSKRDESVFEQKDVEIKVSKVQPKKQQSKTVVKSKRTAKYDIVDMSSKTMKVTVANGLVELFDQNMGVMAKSFLLSSGELTDEEAHVLATSDTNVSIYRDHDFNLTRSDFFTILMLIGLTHMNVALKDGLVDSLFDHNDLKIDFFNELVNTNLVELDIQFRVRELQLKLEKSVSQNERIEAMLGFLLLERANVPKNQNRETIKKALDTSSIMNQATDSFSVLDGLIGSKVSSIKDYKRARGE